jgi:hypothetical protein
MTKTILFLAANPKDTQRLRLDEEVREIAEGLRRSRERDNLVLAQRWAVRPDDLRRAMLDYEPQIVHFSGHATGEQGITLEDSQGVGKLVTAKALQSFFSLFPQVECVILNACYSEAQVIAIAKNIKHVIGMQRAIGDSAAIQFAVSFYDAVGAGKSIEVSFRLACSSMEMAGIPEHLIPILKMSRPQRVTNKNQSFRNNSLNSKTPIANKMKLKVLLPDNKNYLLAIDTSASLDAIKHEIVKAFSLGNPNDFDIAISPSNHQQNLSLNYKPIEDDLIIVVPLRNLKGNIVEILN